MAEREPLPPAPSPERRGGEEGALLPLSSQGEGAGGGGSRSRGTRLRWRLVFELLQPQFSLLQFRLRQRDAGLLDGDAELAFRQVAFRGGPLDLGGLPLGAALIHESLRHGPLLHEFFNTPE